MDRIETLPVGCSGGLVTNVPSLLQASQLQGTAIDLENFEPTVEGGYRRINGYTKWNAQRVPFFGDLYTVGTYSIGATSITITNLFPGDYSEFTNGLTFTVGSSSTTYTVTSTSGADSSTRSITINFTPALDVNLPVANYNLYFNKYLDKFLTVYVTYNEGVVVVGPYGKVFVSSNNYVGAGLPILRDGWNWIGIHNGTTRVDGGGQTGSSLDVKGLRYAPFIGDNFLLNNVVYTVQASTALANGTSTLTISPNLSSSPSDSDSINWVTSYGYSYFIDDTVGVKGSKRLSFTKYRNNMVSQTVSLPRTAVTGVVPFVLDRATRMYIIPDVENVEYTAYFKNTLFFSQLSNLIFSAPYNDLNFNVADGAGSISFPDIITGLKALRDSLIVFCKTSIYRLVGSSAEDFRTELISSSVGCISNNTIKEINGDVIFMTDSGLCLLSDTEKTSGLGISLVSDKIRAEISNLLTPIVDPFTQSVYYSGIYIKNKSQYRVFQFKDSVTDANSIGIIASKADRETSDLSFSKLKGLKVFSCDNLDDATDNSSLPIPHQAVFSNGTDGWVYQMDSGNTFDGTNIIATYSTPYYFFNDPKFRKTIRKVTVYTEAEGAVTTTIDTVLDYNKSDIIQPPSVVVGTTGTTYSDTTTPVFTTPLIGNGYSVSLKFTSNTNTPPYVIQSFTVEYSTNDRR